MSMISSDSDTGIGDARPAASRDAVPVHDAAECRSLRCPLHRWTCDLNGTLLPDHGARPGSGAP